MHVITIIIMLDIVQILLSLICCHEDNNYAGRCPNFVEFDTWNASIQERMLMMKMVEEM